jgi:signal transduction histidine kinase
MNLFALSGLICGISAAILALMALTFGTSKLHRILVYFNSSVAIWGFGCFAVGLATNESSALYGWRFAQTGGIFIAVFFYHMISAFCNLKRQWILRVIYVWGLLLLPFCFLTDLLFYSTRYIYDVYYNDATVLYTVLVLSWLFIVCMSFFEILKLLPKTKGIKRTQTVYLIIGFLTGFLGGASTLIPMFKVNFPPFGNFTIAIYCFVSTYAILRYRLMDIRLVIKKGMVYSLSAGILTSFFIVFVLTMTKYVENVAGLTSHVITIIAALTIAVLFNPLKNSVQKIIDKTFYKRTYNYFDVIRDISRKLTTMFELNTINEFIANTIFDTLGVSSIYVLTAASGQNCEVVYQRLNKYMKNKKLNIAEQGNLTYNSEIIRFMIESEDILINDELPAFEAKLGQDGIQRIRRELEPFGGEVTASVFIEGQLAMILILGEKLSGDMFSREDTNLLKTITDQIAIAAKNVRLYKDKLNSEKLASIGMMSATFAHEVRNPLTSLKTFAQLMPEKYNDVEFREGFSKIVVGEIQKIDDLISDLLDFSAEKKSARVTEYDLVGIVDETIGYVKGKLGLAQKNIVIEKEYARESVIMMGDVKQLRTLFTNIVTNGCQAMNGEGMLRIEINPDGENVNVAITDTGQGISLNDIEKIFDPFVTHKETGTGLGLPISKKIVEEHNGSLQVKSTLSEGSTFTVTLPVQK